MPASRSRSTWRCATSPRTPSAAGARRATPTVHRPDGRPRALYVSSPIGLGHAQRDVAIARELRRLTQTCRSTGSPRTRSPGCWKAEGERIHPASAHLANESHHIESESAEHDLHCFQALRRMDEILAANFMLFHDVVRDERYDLWIGDEAWELDYYLHENPREKRVPFAWLTDFVGFLPMDGRGRAGKLPDRRLQRRHGRPHRRPPRAFATWPCSWATPTTSSPSGSGRSCR